MASATSRRCEGPAPGSPSSNASHAGGGTARSRTSGPVSGSWRLTSPPRACRVGGPRVAGPGDTGRSLADQDDARPRRARSHLGANEIDAGGHERSVVVAAVPYEASVRRHGEPEHAPAGEVVDGAVIGRRLAFQPEHGPAPG